MLLLIIFGLFSLALVVIGALVVVYFGPILLAWVLGRKLRDAARQKDSRGRPVQMNAMANAGFGNLPIGAGFFASLGEDAGPQVGVGEIVMRPTWGVRVSGIVFSGLLIYISHIGYGDFVPASPYTWPVIGVALIYAALATNIYEVRYDREGFSVSGFARSRKNVKWNDLAHITDNGHYLYTFKTFGGKKVEVQKYLVGVRDFLTYAQDQMDYHNRP